MPEEAEANARLIAAAPDMLAALKQINQWLLNGDEKPDLLHVVGWVSAVLGVAALLGGIWAVVSLIGTYGWPKNEPAPEHQDPLTAYAEEQLADHHPPTLTARAAKGLAGHPVGTGSRPYRLVPQPDRRRQELGAAYRSGTKTH